MFEVNSMVGDFMKALIDVLRESVVYCDSDKKCDLHEKRTAKGSKWGGGGDCLVIYENSNENLLFLELLSLWKKIHFDKKKFECREVKFHSKDWSNSSDYWSFKAKTFSSIPTIKPVTSGLTWFKIVFCCPFSSVANPKPSHQNLPVKSASDDSTIKVSDVN